MSTAAPVRKDRPPTPSLYVLQGDEPLRAELCGPALLKVLARELAAVSPLTPRPVGDDLFRRIPENDRLLSQGYRFPRGRFGRKTCPVTCRRCRP